MLYYTVPCCAPLYCGVLDSALLRGLIRSTKPLPFDSGRWLTQMVFLKRIASHFTLSPFSEAYPVHCSRDRKTPAYSCMCTSVCRSLWDKRPHSCRGWIHRDSEWKTNIHQSSEKKAGVDGSLNRRNIKLQERAQQLLNSWGGPGDEKELNC